MKATSIITLQIPVLEIFRWILGNMLRWRSVWRNCWRPRLGADDITVVSAKVFVHDGEEKKE